MHLHPARVGNKIGEAPLTGRGGWLVAAFGLVGAETEPVASRQGSFRDVTD